jgi:hypothetical protein
VFFGDVELPVVESIERGGDRLLRVSASAHHATLTTRTEYPTVL